MEAPHNREPPPAHRRPTSPSTEGLGRQIRSRHDAHQARRDLPSRNILPRSRQAGLQNPWLGICVAPFDAGPTRHWQRHKRHSVCAVRGGLEAVAQRLPPGASQPKTRLVIQSHKGRSGVVSDLVESLNSNNNKAVDLSSMVNKLSSSVTTRASFGTVPELSSEAFLMMILLPYLTGYRAKLEKMREASDLILDEIIYRHRSKRRDDDSEKEDLVDVLLNLQESQNCGVHISMDVIKAIVMEAFLAGSEPTAAAIEWIVSEIINDQRVLQKIQEEVRQVFKNTEKVDEARLGELKYLDMVISEGMRLHPPGPLVAPRLNEENVEAVELSNGYEIPAKTKVIVNAWAISRDPRYWKEPEKFYPERFLECSTDYKGNYFEFIPFGAGRRICPGILFGMVTIKLALANLFFHFNWRLPANLESAGVDMEESFGVSLTRKHPLCLIPVPYKIE
ncbi:Desmethyl-deoxy-podophyllotoxin synthase [Linum perenne]